jgi:hypothetical protein
VAKAARDIAASLWRFYCRLELSIVESFANIALLLWSLRLFGLLLTPPILLAIFRYWIAAFVYLAVLGTAIWKFYSAKAEDIEHAAHEQASPYSRATAHQPSLVSSRAARGLFHCRHRNVPGTRLAGAA